MPSELCPSVPLSLAALAILNAAEAWQATLGNNGRLRLLNFRPVRVSRRRNMLGALTDPSHDVMVKV
eukprot:scaffold369447_cov16-Prasinocladus_malaysianus.AAC.1